MNRKLITQSFCIILATLLLTSCEFGKSLKPNKKPMDSIKELFHHFSNSARVFGQWFGYNIKTDQQTQHVIDINNDGSPDLVHFAVISSLRLSQKDGSFSEPISIIPANNATYAWRGTAIADFDNDKFSDIIEFTYNSIAVGTPSTAYFHKGNGDGQFTINPNPLFTLIDAVSNSAAADLNGDGLIDFAVSYYGKYRVDIFLNRGNQVFEKKASVYVGIVPTFLKIASMNSDDRYPDIIVEGAYPNDKNINVLINDGTGAVSAIKYNVFSNAVSDFEVSDFNADGVNDLMIYYNSSEVGINIFGNDYRYIGIAQGLGSGEFAPIAQLNLVQGRSMTEFTFWESPNNKERRLALNYKGGVSIYKSVKGGPFEFIQDIYIPYWGRVISLSDFNNDGKSDFLASALIDHALISIPGNKSDKYQAPDTYITSQNTNFLAEGDVNQDGFIDVITGPDFAVMINDGKGHFSRLNKFDDFKFWGPTGYEPRSAKKFMLVDLDRDGKLDIFGSSLNGVGYYFWKGQGDGHFTYKYQYAIGGNISVSDFTLSDINKDGNLDLIIIARLGVVIISRGHGNGHFNFDEVTVPASIPHEIYSTNWVTPLTYAQLYTTYTNPIFNKVQISKPAGSLSADYRMLAVKDINGDSYPDIAIANDSPLLTVYMNKGDGSFDGGRDYNLFDDNVNRFGANSTVVITDLNNDNKNDIVFQRGKELFQFMNTSNGLSRITTNLYNNGLKITDSTFLKAVDFNEDGHDELVFTQGTHVAVMNIKKDGSPEFPVVDFYSGGNVTMMTRFDTDGDGMKDLVTANIETGSCINHYPDLNKYATCVAFYNQPGLAILKNEANQKVDK